MSNYDYLASMSSTDNKAWGSALLRLYVVIIITNY